MRSQSIAGNAVAFVACHRVGQFRGGGGFAPQVELAQGPALEVGDHQPRAQPRRLAAQRFQMGRGPFVGFDIGGELFADAGAQHFDRDVPAFGGHRAVDLRDRSRADRVRIDAAEQIFKRLAKAGFNLRLDRGEGHRRQAVLQGQQVVDRALAHQIGAGGERLAQLDRGRADGLKRAGIVGLVWLKRAEPRNPHQPPDRRRGVAIPLNPAQRAVLRQGAAPAQQPE